MDTLSIVRDLISPFLSAAFGLAGVIIGGRIARKTEEKHHRAQMLEKAYQEYMNSLSSKSSASQRMSAVASLRVLCSEETGEMASTLLVASLAPSANAERLSDLTEELVAAMRKEIGYVRKTKTSKRRSKPQSIK